MDTLKTVKGGNATWFIQIKGKMKEKHGTGDNTFYTDTRYWDCECVKNFIHLKTKGNYCPKCKCYAHEMPDSMVDEVKKMYDPLKDCVIVKLPKD